MRSSGKKTFLEVSVRSSRPFISNRQGQYAQYLPLLEELRKNESGFFVHDAWRVQKSFTVNLGLRWDILPPVTNQDDMLIRKVA